MRTTSELRIPAQAQYVVVAKRAAAGFGVVAGFGLEALDELVIAVTQACENAIRCVEQAGGGGQIRLSFALEDRRLEVRVRTARGVRADESEEATGVAAACAGAATSAPAQASVTDVDVAEAAARLRANDLAMRMMGLFVDDCRWRVDERTGALRVRLTKYRVS